MLSCNRGLLDAPAGCGVTGPDRRHSKSPPPSGIGKGVSLKGAHGLMQLMPQTTAHLGASARIRPMTGSGSISFRLLAEYPEIGERRKTTGVCCLLGYANTPGLCAGAGAACDGCVGASNAGRLAGADLAKRAVERHEDKVIIVTTRLTIGCLLERPSMML